MKEKIQEELIFEALARLSDAACHITDDEIMNRVLYNVKKIEKCLLHLSIQKIDNLDTIDKKVWMQKPECKPGNNFLEMNISSESTS